MGHCEELVSDRRWCFGAAQDVVWAALAATDDYTTWWPWLTTFDSAGVVSGARWQCVVRPPLRYSVRFAIDIVEVQRPSYITARVSGDISGRARIDIAEQGDQSEVRLTSALMPTRRTVAWLTALAGPIARRSHDWILDTGARQFAAHVAATSR